MPDNCKEKISTNSLLVVGYWEDEYLNDVARGGLSQVHLLEPDPHQYARKSKQQNPENLNIYNWTLGERDELSVFYLFKPARFSSVTKPKALSAIYRNSVAKKIEGVEVKTLANCCELLSLDKSTTNTLLVGMNVPPSFIVARGSEKELAHFSKIQIRAANNELYESTTKIEKVLDYLKSHNFKVVKKSTPDVLFTEYCLEKDIAAELIDTNNTLSNEIHLLNLKQVELQECIGKKEAQLADLTNELGLQKKRFIKQNNNSNSLLEENAKLSKELEICAQKHAKTRREITSKDTQLGELTNELDLLKKNSIEKNTKLNSLQLEKDKVLEVNAKLSEELGALNTKCAELAEVQKQKDVKIEMLSEKLEKQVSSSLKNRNWAEGLNKKIQDLELGISAEKKKRESMFNTLSLNSKLMTKLQMDNDSLRTHVTEQSLKEKQLLSLINELHQKLQVASEFYLQVQQSYPELIENEE